MSVLQELTSFTSFTRAFFIHNESDMTFKTLLKSSGVVYCFVIYRLFATRVT